MLRSPTSTAAYRRTGLPRAALRWLVALLLVQVLWQTLGHMHGIVHFQGVHGMAHVQGPHGTSPADRVQATPTAAGWVAALLGHPGDESVCQVFDQLGHGDTLASPATAWLPLQPSAALLLVADCEARARWAALFDARGPPAAR